MRWRRILRISIAAVGVGFAVVLYLSRRDSGTQGPAATVISTDPNAIAESTSGRLEHFHGGALEFTIDYKGQRAYPDGRTQFLAAHMLFDTGREIWADELETKGQVAGGSQPAVLHLRGNVRLVEGEALRVEADEATYDDAAGRLDISGPVTFLKGGLRGRGIGATYERDADLFSLLSEASATVDPSEPDTQPLSLSADRMSLARAQNHLKLDGSARIERTAETLAGDNATITFVGADDRVRFLELRGHASVTPRPGESGVPAMEAGDITLSFHPDSRALEHATLTGQASLRFQERAGERAISASWIDLYMAADGRTVTRLDGRDRVTVRLPAEGATPAREIRATTLAAHGTPEAGLQSARFDGNASFVEERPARRGTPAEKRSGKSQVLVLNLNGGFDAIREAEFREAVSFETASTTGEAERARYRADEGRLILERSEQPRGRQPRVWRTDGTLTVDADGIDLAIDSLDVVATGSVATVSRQAAGERGDARTGLFSGSEPVYGSGAAFAYDASAAAATYTGQGDRLARVQQGENRIVGNTVVIEEKTNNLSAKGSVESVFVESAADAKAPQRLSEATADELQYEDGARRATYSGTVRFSNADGATEADRLVLDLSDSRSVIAFEATGPSVFASFTGGHEAAGERLHYDGRTGVYTLVGRPARVKSPDESGGGCLLTIGSQATLTPGKAATWPSLVKTEKVKCEASIR